MARLFLKELIKQLEAVDEALTEIRNRGTTTVWGTTIRQEDKPEYRKLMARRKELRQQVIDYKDTT